MAEHSIQSLYGTSNSVVRASFGSDRSQAFAFYESLIDFVRGVAPPGESRPRLLDVGCGCRSHLPMPRARPVTREGAR
jgi:hypothetical protein